MPAAATRILVSELDSSAQADRFARDPAGATAELTGMLRLGVLISRRVLLTDAMLLDGAYFMRLGPEGVLRELGTTQARCPLTVTGRAPSLREGLEQRLADPGFRWSLGVVEHGATPPVWVEEAWDEWIRFVDDGFIGYEQQDPGFPERLSIERPAFAHGASPEFVEELRGVLKRSDAWARIEAGLAAGDLSAHEHDRLKQWWNAGYSLLIAEKTGADWMSFESGHLDTGAGSISQLHLPERLVTWAKESTPATTALAWDASAKQRTRLHERPTWRRMRDLAYAVTQVAATSSRGGVLMGSVLRLLVAALVILLAVPGWEVDALDHPLTWIVFAGVILTTIPFDSLLALVELLKPDKRTTLILRGAQRRGGAL